VNPISLAVIRQRYAADGGAERFVARTLDALKGHNVRLTLIAREWQPVDGIEVLIVNPFYIGRLWRDWSFARGVQKLLTQRRFDIVQSHERIPGCDVYRAGDGVHAEWLTQRERVLPGWRARLQAWNPYHLYVKRAERKMFTSKALRAVICNSNMVKREIMRWFNVAADKLRIVRNGIDLNAFHPDLRRHRDEVRARHGIPSNATLFLFVGSGFERKGVLPALQALATMPRACLIVVGRDKKAAFYRKAAERLRLGKRAVFVGSLDDVKPYYGAADAFVLPTLYDPFPNVVLEAMASGLPAVVSDKCGGIDIVESGRNGYICKAADRKSLSMAMQSLTDPARAATMGQAARATAESLAIERTADQLSALYTELATRRTGA
jgi:UDP-glucose:(heptosyl)LPS alpha-1,3-glucosyltransferase